MAEEAATVAALVAVNQSSRSDAAAAAEWSKSWKVEFSRFFNFPKVSPNLFVSGKRKPIRKLKSSSGGTWLTASSLAFLQIVRLHVDADPIISVSIRERILEEHCVSRLSIFWPQVSVDSDCPTRGSRVVFFRYTSSFGQTQKFAIRFYESSMVKKFLDIVESMCINKVPVGDGLISYLDPASSDQIGSNAPENRSADQSCSSNPPSPYTPSLPSLSLNDHESRYSPQQFLLDDVEAFSGMPPSFQELLNQCSQQIGRGEPSTNSKTALSNSPLHDSLNADSSDDFLTSLEELMHSEDADLRSQIQKCLEDSSFRGRPGGVVITIKCMIFIAFTSWNVSCGGYDRLSDHLHIFFNIPDILAKIETVIDELGGGSTPPI